VLAFRCAGLPLPLLRFGLAAPLLAGVLGLAVFVERCELVGCMFLEKVARGEEEGGG